MSYNKILVLTHAFLKNSYQKSNFKINESSTSAAKQVKNLLLYALLLIYMVGIFGFLSYNMINILSGINQETVFLGVFLLAIAMLIIFQTIFSSMSVFYYAKDIEIVLPLPLKPIEIFIAKFSTILITEYIVEILFALTPIIIYGILTSAGILFYIYAILILIIFPIIPAIISCILVMIATNFIKFFKSKDKFQAISTILILGVVLFIQFNVFKGGDITETELVEKLMYANGLLEIIQDYFIIMKPALVSLIEYNSVSGLIGLIELLGITAIVYIVFIVIGSKFYLKGALEVLSKGNVTTNYKFISTNIYNKRELGLSYVLKEFKCLIRNSIFLIQCLLPAIIMPIIILAVLFSDTSKVNGIFTEIGGDIYNTIGFCIIISAIQLLSVVSLMSITAISRDRESAIFMKYIPISLYKQFIYKIMPNILVNMFAIFIGIVTLIYLFGKISLIYIIAIVIVAMLLNIIKNFLMLIVDLKKPKLNWDTEYVVVKQNMNMIYDFGFTFLTIGVFIFMGILLKNVNYIIIILLIIVILSFVLFSINRYVKKSQNKLFDRIN